MKQNGTTDNKLSIAEQIYEKYGKELGLRHISYVISNNKYYINSIEEYRMYQHKWYKIKEEFENLIK